MKKKLFFPVVGIFFGAGAFYSFSSQKTHDLSNIKKNSEFCIKIEYCVGCGFRNSAEFFAKKVLESYPLAKFKMIPNEDSPGCLEIFITKGTEEEKLIHSALKGDGRIYLNNVNSIVKKVDDFIINSSSMK